MNQAVSETLKKRKDRMAAIILSSWEQGDKDFRKVVLDQVNDYHDLVVNLMNVVADEGVVLNEEYVQKLDDIHEMLMEG